MIYFVIPLRSKAASRDWQAVEQNFNRTLESCYHQTNPEFRIVVAYHDMPHLEEHYDERVRFVQATNPLPNNYKEMMRDKGIKMHMLMQTVRQWLGEKQGAYILPVDADDLVSNRLAAFFAGRNDGLSYTSRFGWIWQSQSSIITKAKDLWRTCGSCTVIYYLREELPDTDFLCRDESKEYIFQRSHRFLPAYARSIGKEFGVLPFPSTVYVLGTGENHSILSGHAMSWKRKIEGLLRIPRNIGGGKFKEFNIK